jgi:hypothetical protein
MAAIQMRGRGNDPATCGSRAASLVVAATVAVALVAGSLSAADARGGWHGSAHAGAGEINAGGGRRHGNDSHMKAASAERDKLLNTKLKSICRGC